MPLSLSFASPLYDRIVPLATGEVQPTGVSLNYVEVQHPRDVFDRMKQNGEFDSSEMSSSEYIRQVAAGDKSFVAIPVFPLRVFRHGFIAVNTQRIKQAADLAGKRIGVQVYGMTAAVWIRGLLQDEYGVDLSTITWVEGRFDRAGSHGDSKASLSSGGKEKEKEKEKIQATIVANTSTKSLNQLLIDGEIDATIGAELPDALYDESPACAHIQRLFPDHKTAEQAYYRATGIFPIMHLVVMRRAVYEAHPWAATSLYQALARSKHLAQRRLEMPGMLRVMIPWVHDALEETRAVMGDDYWPYGVEANRTTLEALTRYLWEQGLTERLVGVDELFAPIQEKPFWESI
ncbi:hypothetical protein ASPZODRAFT_14837 [Penicilliopsis zonata CBS 506.65]|uniref:SsuA/THI5-like domain-containing protein n=1 Tax=Penicilliopsis zonata CBS 506.65 TaxID=1073090 RepID=A0A1L9SNM5_9EURO|nr:hypothetical protein ASPZODRAFT_14837 [Penicilliopsis zonata CBS 506.65]OJJ48711.1 hypothetical protein ASPZODRAFT_14837 [Penicilliopsis zonata CBS 506.65]